MMIMMMMMIMIIIIIMIIISDIYIHIYDVLPLKATFLPDRFQLFKWIKLYRIWGKHC